MKPLKTLIKEARDGLGRKNKQTDISIRLGVSSKFLSLVESGHRVFDLGRLPVVARVLRIPLPTLVRSFMHESTSIPDGARHALVKTIVTEKPEWQVNLEALEPEFYEAVMMSIDTFYNRQLRGAGSKRKA